MNRPLKQEKPEPDGFNLKPSGSKVLLIEGWRGINHSIALVNQHQIRELLKMDGLQLYHHDLPFAYGHWTRTQNGSGFHAIDAARIDDVPPLPAGLAADCVYRIGAPIRPGKPDDRRRTITFMITELGLGPSSFADDGQTSGFFTRGDNSIVTSSKWSCQRLTDYGYPADKVAVIPLGVDTNAFQPLAEAERLLIRRQMGFQEDETVFVNVGAPLWNKGIDVLLRAFVALRQRGRRVRLILKDQRNLYVVSVEQTLRGLAADCPGLADPDTLASISLVTEDIGRAQLRMLYGVADAYVSPYRAEGFNLPPLEAIACGTPVIVTKGGATDDFCNDDVAWRIAGCEQPYDGPATGPGGRYIEPDLEALIAAMDAVAAGTRIPPERYAPARAAVLTKFTWANAAAQLAALTVGLVPKDQAATGAAGPIAPGPLTQRVRVNSFDIFDTLIARRCLQPWGIFQQVGARIGKPDFLQTRIAAEAQLAGQDYTLHHIYDRLAALWQLTPAQAESLKATEIAAELDNVIPIQENLAKLRHGDVLISDMYMPEPIIRDLLNAAGLDKRVGLVVSTQGKRQGHIWPKVATHFAIGRHLGDNPLSDLEMPIRFGIAAQHTDASAPTLIENWLAQQGLPALSLFIREARLRTWHEEPSFRNLQKIQVQLNLPILLLSSIQLLRVATEVSADRLLFCSRDCDLWLELFRGLAARMKSSIDTAYFYTSRIARMKASADYLAYCRSMLGEHGLIVDACGTGWSLSHLLRALDMPQRDVFFIHKCEPLDLYEEHAPTLQTCRFHTVIHPDRKIPNIGIELINTAEHGSVEDVRIIAGTPVPVLGQEWEQPRTRAAIAVQRKAFLDAVATLDRLDLTELLATPADRIAGIVQALYEHLHTQPELIEVLITDYRKEAVGVHNALQIRGP